MFDKHSAGDNIAAHCTRCKLVLDHVIVAMNGETIAKVKCKTCGSSHKYRDANPVRKTRASVKKEETAKSSQALWETSLAEAKGKEQAYHIGTAYHVGDIIEHSVFGKGIVRKIYMHKCDVLFRDKERLMASGNS